MVMINKDQEGSRKGWAGEGAVRAVESMSHLLPPGYISSMLFFYFFLLLFNFSGLPLAAVFFIF